MDERTAWTWGRMQERVIGRPIGQPDIEPAVIASRTTRVMVRASMNPARPVVLCIHDILAPFGICAECEHTKRFPS